MDKMVAALSITHSAGVLHRDISPDNIMICRDGKVKLIDFGAARQIMAESASNLTVVLKPGYTPMEQYTKIGRQGAWTDIYSLGVSIYYALTEVIIDDPYARMDNDNELAENIHGINNDLWIILKKCTMINSADRYGSAIDLRNALKSVSEYIKAEPIVPEDDDFKEEPETAPEKTGTPKNEEKGTPVTSVPEKIEVTYHSETENISPPNIENISKPEAKEKKVSIPKKKTKSKKPFMIGAAAAVVFIGTIGILSAVRKWRDDAFTAEDPVAAESSTVTEIETVKSDTETSAPKKTETEKETEKSAVSAIEDGKIIIDNNDPLWSMSRSISKDTLLGLDGDIRVTLKFKNIDLSTDGNHQRTVRVLEDDSDILYVTGISVELDEYGRFEVEDGVDELVFIIPDTLKKSITKKLQFDLFNVLIESVTLEEEIYDKTIDFDGEYPNDWQKMKTTIPIEELNCYDGDVRITVDTEIGTFADDDMMLWAPGIPMSFIHPICDDALWTKLNISADNLPPLDDDDMCPLIGTGERKFSFVITQEEIGKCSKDLCLQVYNCVVKKVYIKGVNGS